MFKKFQTGYKVAETLASPIKQAAQTIKKTFTKKKKPKIGGTKKADKIKEAVGIKKKVEKLEKKSEAGIKKGKTMLARSDMVGPTKNLRNIKQTKRQADKFVRETLKRDFKKGGPVNKKFPDHSGDGKITQKDILMAKGVIPKTKNKKKVIG